MIFLVTAVFYWGIQDNYFFSDDFQWVSRAVLAQGPGSAGEIFKLKRRDFNPVFLIVLGVLIKIFGLSPVIFRVISLFIFSAVTAAFFYILYRYFKIHPLISLSAALLSALNVFVSEVVLNLSALVYSLSFLFFLAALKFYLDKKRMLYILFILSAFLTKEAVILGVIPLILFEKEKKNRLFLLASLGGMGLARMLLQLGAASSYTNFLSFSNFFYKLYFIILRAMNISPYSIPLPVGIGVILLFFFISAYFMWTAYRTKERGLLFFLSLFAFFSLFFSLLPKLSSRYFFFPALGFYGTAALLVHHLQRINKRFKYTLVPLVLVSILFNYALVKKEIEDYRILGDFSKNFIREQAVRIKDQINTVSESTQITIFKRDYRKLAGIYRQVVARGNLPKLLPFRKNSIAGVIYPKDLVPIIFYPERIVRWEPVEETDTYFIGKLGK